MAEEPPVIAACRLPLIRYRLSGHSVLLNAPMGPRSTTLRSSLPLALLFKAASLILADDFGTGTNAFSIEFATVGHPGNADDSASGGGAYFSALGGVAYTYRMSVTEVPMEWITKAISGGLTDVAATALSPDHPAGLLEWYEAAAFVNWLNTTTGHHAAYDLEFDGVTTGSVFPWEISEAWVHGTSAGELPNYFRHKDAYYFLPSDDEWYKAAFHKNDGVTGNYWDYATGSDAAPTGVIVGTASDTLVFGTTDPAPADQSGGLSAYGTRGQTGNVNEWSESPSLGGVTLNGSWYGGDVSQMRSSFHGEQIRADSHENVGFRIASVPEPASAMLLLLGTCGLALMRRRHEILQLRRHINE